MLLDNQLQPIWPFTKPFTHQQYLTVRATSTAGTDGRTWSLQTPGVVVAPETPSPAARSRRTAPWRAAADPPYTWPTHPRSGRLSSRQTVGTQRQSGRRGSVKRADQGRRADLEGRRADRGRQAGRPGGQAGRSSALAGRPGGADGLSEVRHTSIYL